MAALTDTSLPRRALATPGPLGRAHLLEAGEERDDERVQALAIGVRRQAGSRPSRRTLRGEGEGEREAPARRLRVKGSSRS